MRGPDCPAHGAKSEKAAPETANSTAAPGTSCRPGGLPVAEPPPPPASGPEWESVTHRFAIAGHQGYVIAASGGGRPIHIEIRKAKGGGTLRGLLDSLAASVCLGLERGVPLSAYTAALAHVRFEPVGHTARGYAYSVVDYVFRWLRDQFPDADAPERAPPVAVEGETCSVCRAPANWGPGSPCPDCGQID